MRVCSWLTSSKSVEVWDTLRGQRADVFQGHDNSIEALTFTADGRRLVTASDDCTLLVWDVAGPAALLKPPAAPDEKELRAAWDQLQPFLEQVWP